MTKKRTDKHITRRTHRGRPGHRGWSDRSRRIEDLEARTLLTTTVLETELNDDRSFADPAPFPTAANNVALVGTIASDRDEDFFRIAAGNSGTIQLTASGPRDSGLRFRSKTRTA